MPNCCAMVPIGASLDSSRRMASALNSGLNCRRRRRAIVDSSAHCAPSEVSTKTDQFHLPFVLCLCPLSFALCPLPFFLCPLPFALCPLPFVLCPLPFLYPHGRYNNTPTVNPHSPTQARSGRSVTSIAAGLPPPASRCTR